MKRVMVAFLWGAFACAVQPAHAGGSDLEQVDDHAEGLKFFGEVKDIAGFKPMSGVVIAGLVKGQKLPMLTQSDDDGRFRLSGFAETVKAANVDVTCRKNGFRLVDISIKPMGSKPDDPVAVECLLAKE